MRLVRIAIVSQNSTVGAVDTNTDRAIAFARAACEAGADLVVFPEQAIGGYVPEDLVLWDAFVDAQERALARFATETRELSGTFAIGLVARRADTRYNCAALVSHGKVHGLVPKEKLPTYNIFYEGRTLDRGRAGFVNDAGEAPLGDLLFEFRDTTVALELCEDLWSPDGPLRRRAFAGAELVVSLSASPYRVGIHETRREMVLTRASDNQVTLVYANTVGGNDGLVFDGGALVSQNGALLLDAPRFEERIAWVTVDLDRTRRRRAENTTFRVDREEHTRVTASASRPRAIALGAPLGVHTGTAYPVPSNRSFFLPETEGARVPSLAAFADELLDALALGLGDYFEKSGAFASIGVALSGGRDSLLCLLIARRYVDRRRARGHSEVPICAFFMPSRFSSEETKRAAALAAAEFGAVFRVVSIDEAFEREQAIARGMLEGEAELPASALQNLQARIRAMYMWSWANAENGLFLQTSNMSEKAVGYTTIGGDMEGALSVIANLPKTVVQVLLEDYLVRTNSEAVRATFKKPASAELAPNMEDERDLMPFPVLDACLALFAGEKMDLDEVATVLAQMFPEHDEGELHAWAKKFGALFVRSVYKWVQTPLSLHVGNLDLDRERALQLPVVQRKGW